MKYSIAVLFSLVALMLPKQLIGQGGRQGVSFGLQGGMGYGLYRDLGASPLTYRGLELTPGLRVDLWYPTWRYEVQLGVAGGGYGYKLGWSNVQAYGGQVNIGIGAMHRIAWQGRWQIWAGALLEDRADMRYNGALGNSSVGATNFVNLSLLGMAELNLKHWVLHCQLALAPASLVLRPGFAYMDNYAHEIDNPVADFMKQYRWYLTGATTMATDLGATLELPNGNRVGLSYRWHYTTSRATADGVAPYCFEQSGHAVVIELELKLWNLN